MKDKLVIIGGGGHAKSVISCIKKLNKYDILGYTDLEDKGLVVGTRYLGSDEVLPNIFKKHTNCKAVIGIGGVTISNKRQQIYKLLKQIGFELPVIISQNAIINDDVSIGEGTIIMPNGFVNAGSRIGKCVIVNTGAIVEHDCLLSDFVHIAVGAIICGGVQIEENCIIGAGAKVLQYKKITENCLVGGGALVVKDIVKEGIYLGAPAKKL